MMRTVWVLGDQLDRELGALGEARPGEAVVLLVESEGLLRSPRIHRQRLHLVLAAMRRFALELEGEGFDVDLRRAPTLESGVQAHLAERGPASLVVTEPNSFAGRALAQRLGAETVRSNQFLTHPDEFSAWAQTRKTLRMEDFYRGQRRRLGYLMDGDEPAGGRWNYDTDNRLPPPREPRAWPVPAALEPDAIDAGALATVGGFGADPAGLWPTSRAAALARLDEFVEGVLPEFGPYEDAMLAAEWRLNHSLLSSALNLGLLRPAEVADRVEAAYRSGAVPVASAEAFIRQVIGWREYVWGVYWHFGERYRSMNALEAHRPLPPVYRGGTTRMRCVERSLDSVERYGWAHHIQRLMILGNLALLAGVSPGELAAWMQGSFVDGADWVMIPNVVGMSQWADGGLMATKPYAAGGAYVSRMSDYCRSCPFDPRARVGEEACPMTTLYWDFLDRNRERLAGNHRMLQPLRGLDRLSDLEGARVRAREVLALLDGGDL